MPTVWTIREQLKRGNILLINGYLYLCVCGPLTVTCGS